MEILFLILGSSATGLIIAEISGIPQRFSYWLLNEFDIGTKNKKYEYIKDPLSLKPFSCGLCLSFWTGLTVSLIVGLGFVYALLIGFTASLLTVLLKRFV